MFAVALKGRLEQMGGNGNEADLGQILEETDKKSYLTATQIVSLEVFEQRVDIHLSALLHLHRRYCMEERSEPLRCSSFKI